MLPRRRQVGTWLPPSRHDAQAQGWRSYLYIHIIADEAASVKTLSMAIRALSFFEPIQSLQ
jgi:hypothetical protein